MSVLTSTTVVGDGTTTAQRAASRWRRWRWGLGILAVVLVTGVLAALPEPRTTGDPLAADNPGKVGAQAAARVLRSQGVDVVVARSVAAAVRLAEPGTTLLVTNDVFLTPQQSAAIAGTGADLVLVGPYTVLADAAPEIGQTGWGGSSAQLRTDPACSDPAAVAAGSVRLGSAGYGPVMGADPDVEVCFPDDSGAGAMAIVERDDRRVTVLADGSLLANDSIDEDGNAALVLGTLGRHDTLVWLTPTYGDLSATEGDGDGGGGLGDLVPDWATTLLALGAAVAVTAALWRMRRLGPLVTEPLPVVVPAGETTRGRGRLYRRNRAHAHAAAALRAGTADRCARRLGLERSASATAVVTAVAAATGTPEPLITDLLYGPPPTDDAAIVRLASKLDHLERQVHRS